MASERSREIQVVAVVIMSVVIFGGVIVSVAPRSSVGDRYGQIPEEIGDVVDANNQFALELYSNIRDDETGNLFFSPYSISMALAMLYEGARGQTAQEIQSVFHFPANDTSRRLSFLAIYGELNMANPNYTLRTADALWVQEGYQILDEYTSLIEEYYAGKATNVDFMGATEQARQTINEWVENKTNNRITDLFPSGSLDRYTCLVLTNALYFNGTWVNQFDTRQTWEENFTISAHKTVRVPMMRPAHNWMKFNYADVGDLQILEMLYEGGNLSMLILLPKGNDLVSLEDSLTPKKLNQWRNELIEQPVQIYIPKFAFATKFS
jgi:serpin B